MIYNNKIESRNQSLIKFLKSNGVHVKSLKLLTDKCDADPVVIVKLRDGRFALNDIADLLEERLQCSMSLRHAKSKPEYILAVFEES